MCSDTHTHTFSQTHNYEDRRTHTYAQPVSEIREWEIENPPDWALYLGIPDLFTLMSAGKKVKKNKSARQQLHVFGKQKLSFILSFGYIYDFFLIMSQPWELCELTFHCKRQENTCTHISVSHNKTTCLKMVHDTQKMKSPQKHLHKYPEFASSTLHCNEMIDVIHFTGQWF